MKRTLTDSELSFLQRCHPADLDFLESYLDTVEARYHPKFFASSPTDSYVENWHRFCNSARYSGEETVIEYRCYRKLLEDTCKRLNIAIEETVSVKNTEASLLFHFFEKALEELSPEGQRQVALALGDRKSSWNRMHGNDERGYFRKDSTLFCYKIAFLFAGILARILLDREIRSELCSWNQSLANHFFETIGRILDDVWGKENKSETSGYAPCLVVIHIAYLRLKQLVC